MTIFVTTSSSCVAMGPARSIGITPLTKGRELARLLGVEPRQLIRRVGWTKAGKRYRLSVDGSTHEGLSGYAT